jgi:hypothetical protein
MIDFQQLNNHSQVVIIIGLPGSGKTTLSNSLSHSYVIFDDFINDFYLGQIELAIKSGQLICLNDPRLCSIDIFDLYMQRILNWLDQSRVHLILFENDPQTCLENVSQRNDCRRGIDLTINNYSRIYDLTDYYKYNYTVIPVWRSTL